MTKSILFVCLGNICRSPIAEACLKSLIDKKGLNWKVDSAGTSNFNLGKCPDHRAMCVLKNHNINFTHSARQIVEQDFRDYEYILAMDVMNLDDILSMKPKDSKAEIALLGQWANNKKDKIIRDPYYDRDIASFEEVYQQCLECCEKFIEDKMHN